MLCKGNEYEQKEIYENRDKEVEALIDYDVTDFEEIYDIET